MSVVSRPFLVPFSDRVVRTGGVFGVGKRGLLSDCSVYCCSHTIPRWPYIGGKTVDLYALYTAVTQLGGWEKVGGL